MLASSASSAPATRPVHWPHILLALILFLSVLTRFSDLATRAYNHDESIHASWSYDLYAGRGYVHNPIYHGPLLYEATALAFAVLGDNDVTGRVPSAVFGIALVLLPWLFRKRLGTRGALVTSALLLISPTVLYYSRFNRHDIYVEFFVVLLAALIFKYLDEPHEHWLFGAAGALTLAYTAMETTFIFVAIFAYSLTTLFTYQWLRVRFPPRQSWSLVLCAALFGLPFFAIFVAWQMLRWVLRRPDAGPSARALPAFDLCIVLGTLSLPLLAPALILALGRNPLDYTSPDGMLFTGTVLLLLFLASLLVGVWWNARRWAICALIFYPVFIFLFTTLFTNFAGIFSGMVGSLGYWLTQQDVARGGQPWYYYLLVMLPLYEFLPGALGLAAVGYFLARRSWLALAAPLAWLAGVAVFGLWLAPATQASPAALPCPPPRSVWSLCSCQSCSRHPLSLKSPPRIFGPSCSYGRQV